jgi:hypothetical protein
MLKRLHSRLSFANVISVVALFVALGGSATAAILVTGKNVKNGSLTGLDVKDNSISSPDVKNGGLLAKDFKAGQLPKATPGAQGAQGPQGTQGPSGAEGAAGPSDIYVAGAVGGDIPLNPGPEAILASITVPAGSYLLGAKVGLQAQSHGSSPPEVYCMLREKSAYAVGDPYWDLSGATVTTVGAYGKATLSLASADTFTGERTVRLVCNNPSGDGIDSWNARVWAIKTANLHTTLPVPTV